VFSSENSTAFSSAFRDLKMIFNTAFCGPWIDGLWNTSSCASLAPTCAEYVAGNPAAFQDVYWMIASVDVYQAANGTAMNGSTAETVAAAATTSAAASVDYRRHVRNFRMY
jgi:hypothetical protein